MAEDDQKAEGGTQKAAWREHPCTLHFVHACEHRYNVNEGRGECAVTRDEMGETAGVDCVHCAQCQYETGQPNPLFLSQWWANMHRSRLNLIRLGFVTEHQEIIESVKKAYIHITQRGDEKEIEVMNSLLEQIVEKARVPIELLTPALTPDTSPTRGEGSEVQ